MAASSGHLGVKTEAVATHVTHPHWYSPPPRKAPRPLLLGDPFPSRPGRRVLPTPSTVSGGAPSCPPHSLSAVWPAPSPGPSHGGSGHQGRRRAGQGREGACGPGPAACRPRGTGPPCGLPPAEPSRPHTTAPPLYSEDTRVGVTEQESSGPLPSPEGPSPHTHTHTHCSRGGGRSPGPAPAEGLCGLWTALAAHSPHGPAPPPPVAERGALASVPSVGRDQALAVSADSASARLWLWGQDQARPTGGRDGQTHWPSTAWAPHG